MSTDRWNCWNQSIAHKSVWVLIKMWTILFRQRKKCHKNVTKENMSSLKKQHVWDPMNCKMKKRRSKWWWILMRHRQTLRAIIIGIHSDTKKFPPGGLTECDNSHSFCTAWDGVRLIECSIFKTSSVFDPQKRGKNRTNSSFELYLLLVFLWTAKRTRSPSIQIKRKPITTQYFSTGRQFGCEWCICCRKAYRKHELALTLSASICTFSTDTISPVHIFRHKNSARNVSLAAKEKWKINKLWLFSSVLLCIAD